MDVAERSGMDCWRQLMLNIELIYNCGCTSPYEFVGAKRIHTDQNERNVISSSAQFFHGFRSREKRHRNISYDDVRIERDCRFDKLLAITGNANDFEVVAQHLNDGRTYLFLVVGNQDS